MISITSYTNYDQQINYLTIDDDSTTNYGYVGDDPTNNPSLIELVVPNNDKYVLQLPANTSISISAKKRLAQSQIVDGVSAFEQISREPCSIEFEGKLLSNDPVNNNGFAQNALNNLWEHVWIPDGLLQVNNTLLNGLGITELIIESVTPTTARGSKHISFSIKALENIHGYSNTDLNPKLDVF